MGSKIRRTKKQSAMKGNRNIRSSHIDEIDCMAGYDPVTGQCLGELAVYPGGGGHRVGDYAYSEMGVTHCWCQTTWSDTGGGSALPGCCPGALSTN